MKLYITIPETPTSADREAVLAPLRAFNISRAGDSRFREVAIMLTDDEGNQVGGLWGKSSYDWLFIELLSVPETSRGGKYGTALIEEAEKIARDRGCIGMWLDTYEFQARGFYEKLGFELFGSLEGRGDTPSRFFLRKYL